MAPIRYWAIICLSRISYKGINLNFCVIITCIVVYTWAKNILFTIYGLFPIKFKINEPLQCIILIIDIQASLPNKLYKLHLPIEFTIDTVLQTLSGTPNNSIPTNSIPLNVAFVFREMQLVLTVHGFVTTASIKSNQAMAHFIHCANDNASNSQLIVFRFSII